MNPSPFRRSRLVLLRIIPFIASITAILFSFLVLLGWWLDLPYMTSMYPGFPTMSPTAAVGFALAGIALNFMRNPSAKHLLYRSGQVCAILVTLLGARTLLEYTFDWDNVLDRWFAPEAVLEAFLEEGFGASFHSGLALFFVGLAILLLDVRPPRGPQPAQVLAIVAGNIGLLALIGYFVHNSAFYSIDRSRDAGMALPSALLSGLLGLGALSARPNAGVVTLVFSRGSGGVLARRLLLLPLMLPLLFALVNTLGQRSGLLSRDFGGWLAWFGYLTTFMCIIWWVASIVRTAELERGGQERRVHQLNAELVEANKELEAFSYSVSHDLRAPLRAVDGFSRILQEECASVLEGEYIEYLNDIRHNAQQMGQLIDALLSFARLSRQPLNKHTVQVDELVKECLEYLEDDDRQRKLQLTVRELPSCEADR